MQSKNNPLITVIIPIYKVEAYLDECVQSILKQTYSNLEIILVDDGSPDRCGEMCEIYAEKDARVKVIHQKTRDSPAQEIRRLILQQVNTLRS